MKLHILTSGSEIRSRKDEIEQFISRFGTLVPNTSIARFLFVAEGLGDNTTPVVLLLEDDDGLAGVSMGRICDRRNNCRVGYLNLSTPKLRTLDVVYGGSIARKDVGIPHLVSKLLDYARESRIQQVDFNYLSTNICDKLNVGRTYGKPNPHWRMNIKGNSYDEVIAGYSKKMQQNVRRWKRKLNKETNGDFDIRVFSSIDSVDEFIGIAEEITSHTYHASLHNPNAGTGLTENMWKIDAEEHRFIGFILFCKGEPVSFRAGSIYGTTMHTFGTAYLPEWRAFSPGMILLFESVEELLKQGVEQIDFGFGDSEYKRLIGNECWYESRYLVFINSPKALLGRFIMNGSAFVSTVLATIVHRFGATQSLRRAWRDRLARRGA